MNVFAEVFRGFESLPKESFTHPHLQTYSSRSLTLGQSCSQGQASAHLPLPLLNRIQEGAL